jgi:CO/xanthine dehydrogenase Mo-binding subunit
MVYHYSMEPHTTIAKEDDQGLTVWSSNSHPFGVRNELAELFGLPLSRVRVVVPLVGGAYGSKSGCKIEPLVVALAKKARRPVCVRTGVAEAMMTCRRHSAICKLKTGFKNDGTLTAKEAEIYLNTGAFAETGPTVTGRTLTRILGPYRIPNIKVTSYCIYTNTVSAASFRSIGGPQTAWATESQMDMIAQKLRMDPLALRRKNLLHKGEELKPKGNPLDADLFKGLDEVAKAIRVGRAADARRPRARPRFRRYRSRRAARLDLHGARALRRQRGPSHRHCRARPGIENRHEPDRRRGIIRTARCASRCAPSTRISRRLTARPARAARPP